MMWWMSLGVVIVTVPNAFLLGWYLRGKEDGEAEQQALQKLENRLEENDKARLRRIANTKRFTASRPGTSPSRVSKANMQRGAGQMHRSGIDETGKSTN